ncbi:MULTISPECIES: hypothetical protein [Nocardia]|nr:hypothetical protein [Nocardia sputorum]
MSVRILAAQYLREFRDVEQERKAANREVVFPPCQGSSFMPGVEGTSLAKRWLESTTRAQVCWVQPDPVAVSELTFTRPGGTFSYDLGGLLQEGAVHNQLFLAEVKNYRDAGDQRSLYREYLAKCYRAFSVSPERCDHFLWLTWAPFSSTEWSKLQSPERVEECTREHWKFNFTSKDEAASSRLDPEVVQQVSKRLWRPLVISREQIEHLSMSREYLSVIAQYKIGKGV